jgi:hypothetical protein
VGITAESDAAYFVNDMSSLVTFRSVNNQGQVGLSEVYRTLVQMKHIDRVKNVSKNYRIQFSSP